MTSSILVGANGTTPVGHRHVVQFYESDDHLGLMVAEFLAAGLGVGEGAIVVATRPHRHAVEDRLRDAGVDVDGAIRDGSYLALDARASLASIMPNGQLDRAAFDAFTRDALARVHVDGRPIRVFGELGALLVRDGDEATAIAEERLWNDLGRSASLSIYCAYPLHSLAGETHAALVDRICGAHDRVLPAESYPPLATAEHRLRAVTLLQQKAASLEAEVAERAKVERLLVGQTQVLEMIARRSSLAETLPEIIRLIESQSEGVFISILVRDPGRERFHLGVAPSLSSEYIGALATTPIAPPHFGPCACAAYGGQDIHVGNIAADGRWTAEWRRLALQHGLRACHASPIIASDGTILGSFAMYFREPRAETRTNAHLIDAATHLAGIAIERSRAESERVRLLAAAQVARTEAETLYRVGQSLAAELDQEKLLQAITDAATALAGAEHGAFFYNLADEHGESYMLYALSGAPREQFADLPMPRNTALFQATFSGAGVIRLDDVTADPRFGTNAPYHGLPDGHIPLKSYLAIPVVTRNAEVIGGLFFGHRRPGIFTARSERMVAGMAAMAAIAIENARLYQQVQQAVRFRDDFLATVAHDLKTPLTSIKGRAQLLRRQLARLAPVGTGRDRLDAGLQTIDVTASTMHAQLDELLDLTRLEIGQGIELQRAPTDLVAMVRKVAEVLLVTKHHRIRIESASSDLIGAWDAQRLTRVVNNLLSNAIKYSPAGSEIAIAVAQEGDEAVLSVRDQGIGIPQADLERIFERFQRARNVPSDAPGTGIGLASARQVVERHGGRLSVTSREGAGSTFTVRLPLHAPDASSDEAASTPASS